MSRDPTKTSSVKEIFTHPSSMEISDPRAKSFIKPVELAEESRRQDPGLSRECKVQRSLSESPSINKSLHKGASYWS